MAFNPPKPALPNPWPFDQEPDTVTVTTRHVLHQCEPIVFVFHDEEDHGWQFHYAGDKKENDILLVALKTIFYHDPTIIEVADLPPGWMAERSGTGEPWQKYKNE